MKEDILARIEKLRQIWEPSLECYLAGRIPEPATAQIASAPQCYNELLMVTNGPVCGCVVFHSDKDYGRSQFMTEILPEGEKQWACVGSMGDNPIFVRRCDDMVVVVDQYESTKQEYAAFDRFLDQWILGTRYLELRGEVDEWFKLMEQAGIV